MDLSIVFFAVFAVIAVAVASRGFRVDEEYVGRWAHSAGLELTARSGPVVRRFLRWSRRSRTVGGLIGFLAPIFYARFATSGSDPGGWSVTLMMAGYLLGALFADVAVNRSWLRPPATRDRRRLADYMERRVLVLQRGLQILAAALVGTYVVLAPHARPPVPGTVEVAAVGFAIVCLSVVVEALQRAIVARRHPDPETLDPQVDDAMRSTSVHALAAGSIGLLLMSVGVLAAVLCTLAGQIGAALGVTVLVCLFVAAIYFWLDLGKPHGFRVRHPREGAFSPEGPTTTPA